MKQIIFFLKISLDAFRDTIKIIKYFKLIKLNGYSVVFKIFYIRFFLSFSSLRNLRKVKFYKEDKDCNFLKEKSFDIYRSVEDLDKFGFTKIFEIKDSIVTEIKKYVFECKNIDVKNKIIQKEILVKNSNEELNEYFERLKKINVSRFTGTLNLNQESVLKNILISNSIIDFAKSYLNSNNFSINATFFVSNPLKISEEEKYKNAQYFHWDNDFRKFFKLYIYLTDVDKDSGPHIYIPASHKKKLQEFKLCRLYSDEKIYKSYPDPKIFTGKSGSLFFVDSYGLHKGEAPKSKSRLMLNVHYGIGKILYSPDDLYIET